jgi:hypothetical protein
MSTYGDRVGSPGGSASQRRDQSTAVVRAASAPAPAPEQETPPSAIRPRARRPEPSPKRAATRAAQNGGEAPVDHYDDLDADEIVSLLDSLETPDLDALLEYERANLSRPRVVSAIEGARARRRASQRG